MARELWVCMEVVKNAEGDLYSLVTRGVFTKKVRAQHAVANPKRTFVLPVRINQVLPEDYFMQHVE